MLHRKAVGTGVLLSNLSLKKKSQWDIGGCGSCDIGISGNTVYGMRFLPPPRVKEYNVYLVA